MPFDRLTAEALLEAIEELAGERDFRQQDQNLSVVLQGAGDRLIVNFGFAGTGDAVDQANRIVRRIHRRSQSMDGALLIRPKLDDGMRGARRRIDLLRDRHLDQQPGCDETIDNTGAASGLSGKGRLAARHAVTRHFNRAGAGRRHARRLGSPFDDPHAKPRLYRIEYALRAHHHARDHAERRQRIARHPFGEPQRNQW